MFPPNGPVITLYLEREPEGPRFKFIQALDK